MRGLTEQEREELIALDRSGAYEFTAALDDLEAQGRAERYDVDPRDGSYRMRTSYLGRLALRLYPATAHR